VIGKFDLQQVWQEVKTADLVYLIPALFVLLTNFMVRSKRWGTVFNRAFQMKIRDLFPAMMIGYLTNNIFPARAGEFLRAFILGNRCNISKSTVLATIIVERLADLLVLMLLLFIFAAVYPLPGWLKNAGQIVGLICLVILGVLFTLSYRGDWILDRLIRRLTFLPKSVLLRIEDLCIQFIAGLKGLQDNRHFLLFTFCTVIVWLLESVIVWMVSQAFSLDLSITHALFILVAVGIGTIIPSSPGYIGTFEFFAVNALATLGINESRALGFTLTLHICMILGTSIIGGLCLAASGQTFFGLRRATQESIRNENRPESI
jgi:glycosyltransferase 2 family protein